MEAACTYQISASWPTTILCNIPRARVTSITNHSESLTCSVLVLSFRNLFRAPNDFLTKTLYLHNVCPTYDACPVHWTSFTLQYYLHDCINYEVFRYVRSSSISVINPLSSKQFLGCCLSDSWNSYSPWKERNYIPRPYRNWKKLFFPFLYYSEFCENNTFMFVSFVGI
jgi:hypothetical protein